MSISFIILPDWLKNLASYYHPIRLFKKFMPRHPIRAKRYYVMLSLVFSRSASASFVIAPHSHLWIRGKIYQILFFACLFVFLRLVKGLFWRSRKHETNKQENSAVFHEVPFWSGALRTSWVFEGDHDSKPFFHACNFNCYWIKDTRKKLRGPASRCVPRIFLAWKHDSMSCLLSKTLLHVCYINQHNLYPWRPYWFVCDVTFFHSL